MSDAMLELDGVRAGHGAVTVLRDVSLSVPRGEIAVLVGANGAGKTTLMHTVAGLISPSAGTVRLGGSDITRLGPEARVRRGMTLVPEGRRLFGEMTVRENLLLGSHAVRRDRRATATTLEHVLELFPILGERARQRADSLSGGEQQMVALGRGLMSRPELIALDEPSLGLAPVRVQELLEAIQRMRADGVTVLLVEQHARLALQIADRAWVLDRGALSALADEANLRASYLGGDLDDADHTAERSAP